ncbi:hypothetical protein JMJ35_009296 [Cladonia borealis]|uniref:Uncharacterized protein n=1 Tax=Cladonia borealis TaxID=184061 RepID=A0AA39UY73_9LECA|nr:hypothetical protein JMJ35_009296 [Cladonia borealis]
MQSYTFPPYHDHLNGIYKPPYTLPEVAQQALGGQQESPLCFYCKYEEEIYSVTEATSARVSAIHNDFVNGISYPPWTLAEVAQQALGVPPRPMIILPQNVSFNEMCPLSLKDMTCPRRDSALRILQRRG